MNDNIILITGASRGIGFYLSKYYISKGLIVIGCSRSDIDYKHPNFYHFKTDITIEQNIIDLFKTIKSKFGKLDFLINNAAINPAIISAALLRSETILNTFNTNVLSIMLICKEAVKMMSRKKRGRIINIGSMAIKHEVEGEALYTATKAALVAYSRVLAKEVAKANITVNVVSPTVIKTDLSSQIDPLAINNILKRNAIQNYGQLDELSNLIDFLISEESFTITGQHIYLGGV
jgi:3-oxoacyl-[acyl-carrier protein] reductase